MEIDGSKHWYQDSSYLGIMGNNVWIKSTEELDILWAKKEKFQSISFYTLSEQSSESIHDTYYNSDTENLISLDWHGGGPGTSSSMGFDKLLLPSGEVLYFWVTDFMRPRLLTVVKNTYDPKFDYLFLQKLFGSNGADFQAQIFDAPADGISIYLPAPWDFLVDLVETAFDSSNCWDKLFEKFKDLWIEEYENPFPMNFISTDLENNIKELLVEEFWEKNEKPRNQASAIAKGHKLRVFITSNLYEYLQNKTPDFRFNEIPEECSWNNPLNKWRIVERYLKIVT